MQRLGAFRVGIILRRLTPIEHAVIASSDAFSMGLRNQVAASYFIGHLGNGPMPQPPQGQGNPLRAAAVKRRRCSQTARLTC